MSLFKPFLGLKEELNQAPIHPDYAYFLVDTGEFYIDYLDRDNNPQRKCINADRARALYKKIEDPEHPGEFLELELDVEDVLNINDIIDVEHGGTGATTAQTARANLDVYSKNEIASKTFTGTLYATGWTREDDDWFFQNWTDANISEFKCGVDGAVPPLVSYTSNLEDWCKVFKAEATPGVGIKFYAKDGKLPEDDIDIVIVDNR